MNTDKPSENPFNIAKKQEFDELITLRPLKNLISPKTAWSSQWSLIPPRNLKGWRHYPYFAQISDFFKNDFSEHPVNLEWKSSSNYFNCSS